MSSRSEPPTPLQAEDALVIVDVQNDFLPGGSLGVPDGDAVIPVLNDCIQAFEAEGLPVFATRDWHTPDHCSFTEQGGIWPPHCIADTTGAEFAAKLRLPASARIVSKATTADKDAYSGFDGTDLAEQLRARGVKRLYVGGLATDYCVLNTVKDALEASFAVYLIEDAIRAVNVEPGDGDKAVDEMVAHGAMPIRWRERTA